MDSNLLLSGRVQATPPTPADGDAIPLSMTSSGRTRVDTTGTVSISGTPSVTATISGTPAVTISGTPAVTATISGTPSVSISGTPSVTATISGTPAVTVSSGAVTTTPASGTFYSLTTAATTNAGNIKTSAGSLFEISVFNATAATIYVRLYNKGTAPTAGSDTSIVVIPVTTNASVVTQFGPIGKRFSAGIGIAVTAAAGNGDNTAVTAGAQISATYL